MLNQYFSGHSHVTSQPVSFPPHPDPSGMLSFLWEFRAANMGTHANIGKRFCKSNGVFFRTIFRKSRTYGVLTCRNQFTHHRRGRMRIKHQIRIRNASRDRQPEIQSSLMREMLQRIMGHTNNDCRQIPHTSNACWLEDKIRYRGMYLFTISYGSYAVDQRSGDG